MIANPHLLYVFGDNLQRVGMGGQAGAMRGEPNAHGIATKCSPGMSPYDFFIGSDQDFLSVESDIGALQAKLTGYSGLVVPLDGLGSGLAELDIRAPKLFAYLNSKILTIGN